MDFILIYAGLFGWLLNFLRGFNFRGANAIRKLAMVPKSAKGRFAYFFLNKQYQQLPELFTPKLIGTAECKAHPVSSTISTLKSTSM